MRKLCVLAVAAVASLAAAQTVYPAYGVRLLSHINQTVFPGSPSSAAAIYGYTSPSGREYATIGLRNGTGIVEITNPTNPQIIAHVPGPSSLWHENVVMGNYCYAISDSTGVGIQIIDLSNVDSGNIQVFGPYTGNGMATVHTIEADPTTKRLFANGGTRNFAILDASNPTALTEIGRWTTKYVHDSVIRNYTSGPYAGKQIAFLCCGTSGLYIADVTNPANIVVLSSLVYYPGQSGNFYCHSASLTPDNHYLLVNDEFDENKNITGSCTTKVVDVSDLANPVLATSFLSGVNTIDHNSNLRDGFLFLSAYKAGMRIYNAANPLALSEVGYLDTYPSATDDLSYNGDWGVFAQFPSGNVVLSDIDDGLFVVDPSEAIGLGAPLTGSNMASVGAVGTLSDLRKSDDRYVTANFGGSPVVVFAETTIAPRANLKVTLEASGQARMTLRLRNLVTNAFDPIGTFQLTLTDGTFVVPNLPAATYVSAAGQIECQISTDPTSRAISSRTRVDMVRFDVLP